MTEEGIVKNTKDGFCEVVIRRKTACGDNCASCGGSCRLNFRTVTVKNPIGAKAGDTVIIEMEGKKVLLSAFLVYILPLAVFIASYYLMKELVASETVAASISSVLTVLAFGISVLYDRHHKVDFIPVVTKLKENS